MRYKRFSHAIGLLLPFFILLSVALVFLVIQNRRYRSKHKEEIFSNELNLRKMIQTHKKDEMEIEPNNVELYELLGEGKTHTKEYFFNVVAWIVAKNSLHFFHRLVLLLLLAAAS